ncbi:hypothetical protein B0H12DRAFT_637616 [Mycena haematopus]|nr:hypothetical protein B0H12DRAFT_637616 [Mycena haematopus]
MAACHRALDIPEIVRMICGEANWPSRTTLVRLATTSRIFTDPALDIIWHYQSSLMPLIKCMPETLWEVRGVRGEGAGIMTHLLRPIISTDLPRLLFYSARVRSLNLRDSSKYGSGTVHPDFLKALDMSMPAQAFPKLSHFAWFPRKRDVLSIMRHFLGPRTQEIHLKLEDTAMLSILPFAQASCPLVSEFRFDVPYDRISLPLVRTVSDAVCGWKHLTSLSVPDLDKTGFMHVAELAFLTDLSLTFVADTSVSPSGFLSGPTFPALLCLFVCCKTARFCTGVVQTISSRQLRDLTIHTMSVWTTSAWQELHTAIHDCLDQVALRYIGVEEWRVSERPADNELSAYVLSSDVVRPLLAFKRLTNVSFQVRPCLDVDDEFLEEMAQAWPDVGELSFGTDAPIIQAPKATLKCLIAFARHCPELMTLGIRMDATDVPAITRERTTSLNDMYVGTSLINTSKEGLVAAFISNLFPELQHLSPFSGDSPLPEPFAAQSTSWHRVSQLIPVFASVRSQEEEFWAAQASDEEESEGEASEAEKVEEVS